MHFFKDDGKYSLDLWTFFFLKTKSAGEARGANPFGFFSKKFEMLFFVNEYIISVINYSFILIN